MILNEDDHLLFLNMHHIISDGWSIGLFSEELCHFYIEILTGKQTNLPELPIQYIDFASWQRKRLENGELNQQLSYWEKHLKGSPPFLELPTDFPRPAIQTFKGKSHHFILNSELTQKLNALSQSTRTTLFMNLLSIFSMTLSRYSNMDDLVIGSPIAGRTRSELERIIGFFANTLALRINLSGNPSFKTLLEKVKDVFLGCLFQPRYSF